MLKPLGERTPDINKNFLKERESRKIKDQEQTSITSSLDNISTCNYPGTSLFKLLLDQNQFYQNPLRSEIVFFTIAVVQKDGSITVQIKKIPQNIEANELILKTKWQD